MKKHNLILLVLIALAIIAIIVKLLSNENVVTIEIEKGSISNEEVSIVITDKSSNRYIWGSEYYLQEKKNNEWERLTSISSEHNPANIFNLLSYTVDENHQISQKFNWNSRYGKLPSGTYRVEKPVYDTTINDDVYFYSNEFEIK